MIQSGTGQFGFAEIILNGVTQSIKAQMKFTATFINPPIVTINLNGWFNGFMAEKGVFKSFYITTSNVTTKGFVAELTVSPIVAYSDIDHHRNPVVDIFPGEQARFSWMAYNEVMINPFSVLHYGTTSMKSFQWKDYMTASGTSKSTIIKLTPDANMNWQVQTIDQTIPPGDLSFGDKIGFYSDHVKGYLSAQDGSTPDVQIKPTIGAWEQWELRDPNNPDSTDKIIEGDKVNILSIHWNKYLSARKTDAVSLVDKASTWELWILKN